MRYWRRVQLDHEPATSYAVSHRAPMPMRWGHKDEVGRVVALRRQHNRLYAVAETQELEPSDLEGLTEKLGELRWSTSTNNLRNEPLRIDEISLTNSPATIGLPAIKWYKFGVSKGNPPGWVTDELERADKLEFRHRGELRVHDLDYAQNDQTRDMGMITGSLDRAVHKGRRRTPRDRNPLRREGPLRWGPAGPPMTPLTAGGASVGGSLIHSRRSATAAEDS